MIQEIEISKLFVHPNNVRKTYNDIEELADSIKAQGILQNLTVVPNPDEPGTYLTVIGNRRLTAAKMAGLKTAPCIVSDMSEKEQASVMLLENMQRNDLTIYEQAQGFQMMLDFGENEDTIAEKTGFSRTTIRHRLNIAKLDQNKLREREADDSFQLSLKDLYALEKVADIEKRNKILSEARDSRDLAWKAQSAAQDAKREANAAKVIPMLEAAGVKVAPEKASQEIYTNKWQTIDTIDLDKEMPDVIELNDDAELFYLKYYREIKIIKKAKKVEREETEEERKRKERDKNKKQIKAIITEMNATRRDFILNIISGKVEKLKDTTEIQKALWQLIYDTESFPSQRGFAAVYCRKDNFYDVKQEEEKEQAEKWADGLDMFHQMMLTAYKGCEHLETVCWDGTYNAKSADYIKRLYLILAMYGLHIDDEEQKQVLDGTYELYVQPETKVESEDDAEGEEAQE